MLDIENLYYNDIICKNTFDTWYTNIAQTSTEI